MPIIWTMPDGSVQVTRLVESVLERERLGALTAEGKPTRIVSAGEAREILRIEAGLSPEARQGYAWTATESTNNLVLRLAPMIQAKTLGFAGGVPALVTEADLPTDRTKRHAWRLKSGKIVVDPAVPDLPHPKQALLDDINRANTVAELKALLRRVVAG